MWGRASHHLNLRLLAVLILAGHAQASDASQTLSSCELLLREMHSKGDQISGSSPGGCHAGISWRAVQGLIVIAPNETDGPYLRVCSPENGTLTQLVRIFVLYAQQNPKELNESAETVALRALQKAYPCK